MINCRRIHDRVSFSAAETYSKCDLAYPCGPHLTNRLAIPSPSLSLSRSLAPLLSPFLSRSSFSVPLPHPVYFIRSFSPAPARYSHSFAVPVDLCLLSALFSPLSFSLLSRSTAVLLRRPCPFIPPAFRGASVAKSRLYLVSCKSEQFASLINDSYLEQQPL